MQEEVSVTELNLDGQYQALGDDIIQKRAFLEQFEPQSLEDKVWLLEQVCRDCAEGSEKFFNLVKELTENAFTYSAEFKQRIKNALNNLKGFLFISFLASDKSDKVSLFLYFSKIKNLNENNISRPKKILHQIIKDNSSIHPQQLLKLIRIINKYSQNEINNIPGLASYVSFAVEKIKARLEKCQQVTFVGKGYFSKERRAVRRLLAALDTRKSLSYRQHLLKTVLNGSDKETAKLASEILPNLYIKSNDGKRAYWINFDQTEAAVIDPVQQKPIPTIPNKKFHVTQLPEDQNNRRKILDKAEQVNEYFHMDVAGDYVISDYVPKKDWSEYDGRVAPKKLPFIERLASLCEKLRNLAEGKPPLEKSLPGITKLRPYTWTRRELHRRQNQDIRKEIDLLVPLIRHYLGVSDPLLNMNANAAMELAGVNGVDVEFKKTIGRFLARMLGEADKRPNLQEVLEFFECAERYYKSHSEEEMEVIKFANHSRHFDGESGLPKCPKARWLWFVELSNLEVNKTDRLSWRRLAKAIADEKEKYTSEQRQFLRRKLQEYRANQYDRDNTNGEYQKIIDAAGSIFDEDPRDLFPLGEEKEALIGLLEEVKANKAWKAIAAKIAMLRVPTLVATSAEKGKEDANKVSEEPFSLREELLALVKMAAHAENQGINFNNQLVRKMLLRLENPDVNILHILSTPVESRAAGHHFAMYEYLQNEKNQTDLQKVALYEEIQKNAWNHDIALHVFCTIKAPEKRQAMAKYIVENMCEYSGAQVVQFFNKLKEYKLDRPLSRDIRKGRGMARINPARLDENQTKIKEARDTIVEALKAYRSSLFYFNPKRLDVSHVIRILKDPSLQIGQQELIEPEYSYILDNILHCIPIDVLNTFQRSRKTSTSFNHYKLVKTPSGKIFAVDTTQVLGNGGYGKVYLAHLVDSASGKFSKKFAVKTFYDGSTSEEIEDEFKALQKQYFEVEPPLKTSRFSPTYLFMEYVPGKELGILEGSGDVATCQLDAVTKELPLVERFKAIAMLILEMSSAHQHRKSGNAFIHGDIKPNNVLLDIVKENGVAKVKTLRLLDFGKPSFIARFINPLKKYQYSKVKIYTPRILAPESLEGEQVVRPQSDLRALVPTILPLLGETRPFTSNDDVNRYFNMKGLLKDADIPVEIRAALFQYLIKMESWNPDERGNDDEAFHFFNAIYQYFRCTTQTEKDNWKDCEKYQILINDYKDVVPKNFYRWFEHLHGIENPDQQTKTEMQRVAEMVYGQLEKIYNPETSADKKFKLQSYFNHTSSGVVSAEIKLLQFFTQNDATNVDNKARWKFLVRKLSARELYIENFVSFALILNKKREIDKAKGLETVFYGEDNKAYDLDLKILEKFVLLSKTKNHEDNQLSWGVLGKIIVMNIENYNGAQLLTILRKINKFNKDGGYKKFSDAVKAKLNAQWETACKDIMGNISRWNRSAVNDLKTAIDGQCFWSRNNRRYLKNAVSESPNQAVDAVVRKLGKVEG